MKITIMTLFPEMCEAILSESIIGRAREAGYVEINCVNIREYTDDKHGHVDDAPYGGGTGMVMQAEPIYNCFKAVTNDFSDKTHLIYMSPQGKTLTQDKVRELSELDSITILCGHYEGVDERVIEEIVDEEISIGDYVLTGGELPACVLADSVCRMLDGVLANEDAYTEESHFGHLLEYPQYTRPAVWKEREVPPVLLSGNHAKVDEWRFRQSVERTLKKRPDMLENVDISDEEKRIIDELSGE
ncbi:MAG: tRNA (guanosine(37)-N1)-methyltransferase TrmD [Clostridia bacterium]|nr:tRNA (guanosine(37)-N1)-methyltransferase TrmD [Clostridia bacterium]